MTDDGDHHLAHGAFLANPEDDQLSRRVSFMIVGTRRSGTTLVQRLACEIPGVRVPPETQFFHQLARRLLRSRSLPLDGEALRHEIEIYSKKNHARHLGLDPSAIVADLGGATEDVFELFSAIVRYLAGPAIVYGEKSPPHLLWCRALGRRFPHLKFVAVVRDPRAVVASSLKLSWNTKSHVLMAQQWSLDQRYLLKTRRILGDARVLLLRYEDVVSDPQSARRHLAHFLDVPFDGGTAAVALRDIAMPRETWKANVVDPVDPERAVAWQASLSPSQIQDISAICRHEMVAFGYHDGLPDRLAAYRRIAHLPPRQQARRMHFAATRFINVVKVENLGKRMPQEVV